MNEETLFAAALEKSDPAERRALLDEACAGNVGLRRRMERLLAADEHASDTLSRGAAVATESPTLSPLTAGDVLAGRFKLRQLLGTGGMGEVWVADQAAPVQRRIALKLIRPGLASAGLVARFDQERQALARMDHPGIARVLDAGTTETGRPYFVMELIKGVPITEYCDTAKLSSRERLELFVPVCQAVQHAHQKGIIHRDLKPSNILVALYDGEPVVKVIDFGIAKATGERLSEQSVYTEVGTLVGTLEYMSPEQAELNNLDIDTRSDVYSLGVVLYELLTGSVPHSREGLRSVPFVEMLRIIKEVDPPRPSTRLASDTETLPAVAAARQTEPKKLTALVRGELDLIVMKCLEKDRNRRYDTASSFASDLQRYLTGETVLAVPPSVGYRLRKFVRRNKGRVLAASLLLLALLGGIVGTTIGLVRAERAKDTAEKRLAQIEKGIDLLGSIFENLDPQAEEKEGRPLRTILGDRLDLAAAELEGEAVGDPLVVARLQDRLGRTYLSLGHAGKAEALFAKAVATRLARLGADHSLTLRSMSIQAMAHHQAGKSHEAVEQLEQVHGVQVRILGADHVDTLTTLNGMGEVFWETGAVAKAIPLLESARDGRMKQLGEDHDDTIATLQQLASAYMSAQRASESIALHDMVLAARVKKHGADHPLALAALNNLGVAYRVCFKMKQAVALFEKAKDAAVPKLGLYHPLTLNILANLANMHRAYGKTADAIALGEEVREKRVMVLGAHHWATLVTLNELGQAYRDEGKLDKALPLFQQAAVGVEKLGFAYRNSDMFIRELCESYEQLKQYDKAEDWRRKCLPVAKARYGPESDNYAHELGHLGLNLMEQKRPADAEPFLRECLAIHRKIQPAAFDTFDAQSLLGAALLGQQNFADAEPLLVQAYQGLSELMNKTGHDHHGPPIRECRTKTLVRLVQLNDAWGKPAEAAKWRVELEKSDKSR